MATTATRTPRHFFEHRQPRFDGIAETIDRFTEIVGSDRYAVYVFDYGAPTGFRLAVKHPDRITAIISQNGNAYEEDQFNFENACRCWQAAPAERSVSPDGGLTTEPYEEVQWLCVLYLESLYPRLSLAGAGTRSGPTGGDPLACEPATAASSRPRQPFGSATLLL